MGPSTWPAAPSFPRWRASPSAARPATDRSAQLGCEQVQVVCPQADRQRVATEPCCEPRASDGRRLARAGPHMPRDRMASPCLEGAPLICELCSGSSLSAWSPSPSAGAAKGPSATTTTSRAAPRSRRSNASSWTSTLVARQRPAAGSRAASVGVSGGYRLLEAALAPARARCAPCGSSPRRARAARSPSVTTSASAVRCRIGPRARWTTSRSPGTRSARSGSAARATTGGSPSCATAPSRLRPRSADRHRRR